jgi:2-polyprenyl-3-methyl-5-hydroxy-6-metoxy-1,4-benzoquinol methylase
VSDFFTRPPTAIHKRTVSYRGEIREVELLDFLDPSSAHYATSFGAQWDRYRKVQIDRFNGTEASRNHLKMFALGNIDTLRGKTILEIGSGAGRFTDHLVDLGATVITVDPSAIFFNVALGAPNLVPIRADLFDIPIDRSRIDVVFCRGVVQHTSDTRRAIERLFNYVKPGGLVMFDVYHLKWFTPFVAKYWLRPVTRRLPEGTFIRFAEKWVPRLLSFKSRFVKPILPAGKFGTNLSHQIVPVADFTDVSELSPEDQIAWSVLDTVDMYTPRYDGPMTWRAVMTLLNSVGAANIRGDHGSFCFIAEATR